MVSLRALQALAAVRARGSVTAAAVALGYTPSAVSQQLNRLERETRTVLLEPHGRTVRLTIAGEQLANAAEAILREWESAAAGLELLRGTVCGVVRVAAFPTVARGLLPQVLSTLRREEPELTIQLAETPSHSTIEMLKDGDCDLAVAHDWPETPLNVPPGIRAELLGTDFADVILPADHRHAQRPYIALEDLADERWVAEPGSVTHDLLVHLLARSVDAPRVEFAIREFPTQLALIEAGLAVGLIPRLGRADLPDGVRAVPTDPPAARRVYGVIRDSSADRPAVQSVLQALKAHWPDAN
ncbi:MAG: Transcriptional regulator, LysR family [Marmoricola sp.]|jgi:DNA-binding transcriptional LysR family regulator|nr:Transcriptional regulator, LysR family [Marmoricola sp.]